ncbi:hypothetical protein Q3G72_014445 [Acer saccharum]|nr:hypothetical protein Q3G72_014445 [Acer saccharum]
MAEDKAVEGVGKITHFAVDPRVLRKAKPGTNRPIDKDHVRRLADAFKRGAVFPPLDVSVEDGALEVVDGQHRHEAALLAIGEGAEIRTLECRQFRGNDEDKVFLQISSQDGLKMTPLVLGDRYKKLVAWGWSVDAIAERAGKSGQHVRDSIKLAEAPMAVRKMVEKGEVSADVARTAVKKHGNAAGGVLRSDLDAAQAAGKTRVTAGSASTTRPSKLQTAMDLLERMRPLLKYENASADLVDEYQVFMGVKQ